MSIERIRQLNEKIAALERQEEALREEKRSASEYERGQIGWKQAENNRQLRELQQEKESLKKSLTWEPERQLAAAQENLNALHTRQSQIKHIEQNIDHIVQAMDSAAISGAVKFNPMNALFEGRGITDQYSSQAFLAWALRDVVRARLEQEAARWLEKNPPVTNEQIADASGRVTELQNRIKELAAL